MVDADDLFAKVGGELVAAEKLAAAAFAAGKIPACKRARHWVQKRCGDSVTRERLTQSRAGGTGELGLQAGIVRNLSRGGIVIVPGNGHRIRWWVARWCLRCRLESACAIPCCKRKKSCRGPCYRPSE